MKTLFANFKKWEHYQEPSIDELKLAWTSDKTIFIFDTSVLLGLYENKTEQEVDSFCSILRKLKPRIWLPYQVAFEFFQNSKSKKEICQNTLQNNLSKIFKDVVQINFNDQKISYLKNVTSQSKEISPLVDDIEKIMKDIKELHDNISKNKTIINDCIDNYINNTIKPFHDRILNNVVDCFDGMIGSDFSEMEREKIYIEGDKRHQNKFPLLVKDDKKGEKSYFYHGIDYKRKYGDFIIWKQIIQKSQNEKNLENIIFITDDRDWFKDKKAHHEAHPELVKEILLESHVKLFQVYNFDLFLKYGNENLNLNIDDEIIDKIKEREEKRLEIEKKFEIDLLLLEEKYKKEQYYRRKAQRAFNRIKEKEEKQLADNYYHSMDDYEFYKQCRLEELADERPDLSWEQLEALFEWEEKFWDEWDN